MAHNPEDGDDDQEQKTRLSTVWSWQPRRRGFQLRRRRVQTQRLGGKKPRLVNMLRKMTELKVKYVCVVRKLKECYRKLVKDMAEAGSGSVDNFHQMLFMDTAFAVPIGITFSGTFHSSRFELPDHHRRQPKSLFV